MTTDYTAHPAGGVRRRVIRDALIAGLDPGEAIAYADAICVYLGLAVSNTTNRTNSLVTWEPRGEKPRNTFRSHYLAMSWDFAEVPVPAAFGRCVENLAAALERLPAGPQPGYAEHKDAAAGA